MEVNAEAPLKEEIDDDLYNNGATANVVAVTRADGDDDKGGKEKDGKSVKKKGTDGDKVGEQEGERLRCERCCGPETIFYRKVLIKCPRTFSLLLGVYIPMFFLITISWAVGLWLAMFEAPVEVAQNDARVRSTTEAQRLADALLNISASIPKLCIGSYFRDDTVFDDVAEFILFLSQTQGSVATTVEEKAVYLAESFEELQVPDTVDNVTDLTDWMVECGQTLIPVLNTLYTTFEKSVLDSDGSLTFNWIRCIPGATGFDSFVKDSFDGGGNFTIMRPEAQRHQFFEGWKKDQERLYYMLLDNFTEGGNSPSVEFEVAAKVRALELSRAQASGRQACEYNAVASAWFWFTVLSTIGYGNQAPATGEGRLLVFVLGFVSLLVFGGILNTAGVVANAIADDLFVRLKLKYLSRPLWAMAWWGSIYFAWMVFTSFVTINFKHQRMAEYDFTFNDAYWFSYLSSTTIGLGDIYLDPEVMVFSDLFTYPLLMLFNFVYISAFLGKLVEFYGVIFPKGKIVDKLLTKLKSTDVFFNQVNTEQIEANGGEIKDSKKNGDESLRDKRDEMEYFDAVDEIMSDHLSDVISESKHSPGWFSR